LTAEPDPPQKLCYLLRVMKSRMVALALLALGPAVAFRVGGVGLWIVMASTCVLAAVLSAWELHQDGILRDVMRRQGFDLMLGLGVALGLLVAVTFVFNRWIAPVEFAGGVFRRCRLDGPLLPRLEPHGAERVSEWLRGQVCRGYGASLAIDHGLRAPVIFLLASLEEFAWRGGVQQALSERLGSTRGWLATSVVYALVHALTPTPGLALLALPCGLLWGGLYRYRGRLVPGVFSHGVFSMFLFATRPLVTFA
jgi:membrane protease YdiL (CAAX protease family)